MNRHLREVHTATSRDRKNCFERFFESVRYGSIFGCISCHIANFARGVEVFDDTLQQKMEEKYEHPEVFSQLIDEAYYTILHQNEEKRVYLNIDKDGNGKKDYFMCKTCKMLFLKNKLPSRCILNECRTAYKPEALRNMTDVEATLIAQNLQFQNSKSHR